MTNRRRRNQLQRTALAVLLLASGLYAGPRVSRIEPIERKEPVRMATVTTWAGTTGDASLDSNWSNGVPDSTSYDAFFGTSVYTDVTSGFGSVRARGTLVYGANPSALDEVDINGTTYTYVASPSSAFDVDIGADAEESANNLLKAINLSGTPGTEYGSGTTAHPTVTALSVSSGTVILTVAALDAGTGGNSLTTTATLANGAASGALLNNVEILENCPVNIHTEADPAYITADQFIHRGYGEVCIKLLSGTRFIIDSDTGGKAAYLLMDGSLTSFELVTGWAEISAPSGSALPDKVFALDASGRLDITADSSLTGAELDIRGCQVFSSANWTEVNLLGGGILEHTYGAVAKLRSAGTVYFDASETLTLGLVLGGRIDFTRTSTVKTATAIYAAPGVPVTYREGVDSITLYKIGTAN